jgi:hypothetical protein
LASGRGFQCVGVVLDGTHRTHGTYVFSRLNRRLRLHKVLPQALLAGVGGTDFSDP